MQIVLFHENTGISGLGVGPAELEVGPSHFLLLWEVPTLKAHVPPAVGVTRQPLLVCDDLSLPALGMGGIFT